MQKALETKLKKSLDVYMALKQENLGADETHAQFLVVWREAKKLKAVQKSANEVFGSSVPIMLEIRQHLELESAEIARQQDGIAQNYASMLRIATLAKHGKS